MPDITKCINHGCELRDTCYRFTCESSGFWQSVALFIPDDGYCKHFLNNRDSEDPSKKWERLR